MRTTVAVVTIAAMLALTGCAAELTQQAEPRAFVVYFQNGSVELTPDAHRIVAEIVSAAQEAKRTEITIESTAVRTADASSDASLAARRALVVEDALRAAGVTESVIGPRDTDIAADTKGVAARRVKVLVVAQN